MAVHQTHYEDLLATYSNHKNAVALLRQYRPYLEKVPSIRRSQESVITIPLPVVQVRQQDSEASRRSESPYELIALPCDLALLMCDPDWKIKTGVEIFVFIYRPGEDFSVLLNRWRQTQVLLSRGYSWAMPLRYQDVFNEGAEKMYPLFILFSETPWRVQQGMRGAGLPYVVRPIEEPQSSSDVTEVPDPQIVQPSAELGDADGAAGAEPGS